MTPDMRPCTSLLSLCGPQFPSVDVLWVSRGDNHGDNARDGTICKFLDRDRGCVSGCQGGSFPLCPLGLARAQSIWAHQQGWQLAQGGPVPVTVDNSLSEGPSQ